MTDNTDFDNNKIIHKSANNALMVVFEDMTNDTWDVRRKDDDNNKIRNNVQIKFIRFDDNNNTKEYIPVFVNADELMAVMNTIRTGNFSKIFNSYKNYGGSTSGLAQKREGDEPESIVQGIEARVFSIFINNGKLTIQAEVFEGSKTNNGAIKKNGDAVSSLYLALDTTRAITMAEAVYSYLQARKTVCISNSG